MNKNFDSPMNPMSAMLRSKFRAVTPVKRKLVRKPRRKK
jgi:hypothetical protein